MLSVAEKVYMVAGIFTLSSALIWMGFLFYYCYRKLDVVLGLLENCIEIETHKFLIEVGPWGRVYLLGRAAGLFIMPGFYLRRGTVDAGDLEKFPPRLKKQLVLLYGYSFPLTFMILVLGLIAQFDLV